MKQKDLALIAILVILSGVISFVVSGMVFAPSDKKMEVERVDVITSDFPQPSSKYFNNTAVNPTQNVQIGDNENPNPFTGGSQ